MTKYQNLKPRLSTENLYLYEERIAIKMDSGIPEKEAEEQTVEEMGGGRKNL